MRGLLPFTIYGAHREEGLVSSICYFITATLAKSVEMSRLQPLLVEHQMTFLPVECSPAILSVRENDRCYRPIQRHCDCDTTLGIIRRRRGSVPKSKLKRMRRHSSFSEEAIAEFIAGQKHQLEKAPETVQWYNFIHAILDIREVWHLGLILQWWDPNSTVIKRHQVTKKADITPEFLISIEEEVFYDIQRSADIA